MKERDELLAGGSGRLDPVGNLADQDEPGWVTAGRARRPVKAERGFGRGGGVEGESGEARELIEWWRGKTHARGRTSQARKVLAQAKRSAPVDPQRLEHRAAASQRIIVGADDRLVEIDDAATENRERESGHWRAPIVLSR